MKQPNANIKILDVNGKESEKMLMIMNKNVIRQSSIKFPDVLNSVHAFIIGDYPQDDIIVHGYVRKCWKEKQYQEMRVW